MDTQQHKLFYGWIIIIASFVINGTLCGVSSCFGVFLTSLESEFNLTRAVTSSVFSTNMVLYGVFAVLGGRLLDRSGPKIVVVLMALFTGLSLVLTGQTRFAWQLFVTYGLLLAMGIGARHTVLMSTTSRWFHRKRGLALGIVSSAAGFGILAVSPVAGYLIQRVDWRTAYIIMGAFTWAVVIPLSRLLKKNPSEIGEYPDGAKSQSAEMPIDAETDGKSLEIGGFSLPEAFRTFNFWLYGLMWLLASSCHYLLLTHLVPHATDMGVSALQAAKILGLLGGGNIAGKVVIGRVSDSAGRRTTASLSAVAAAGVMIGLNFSEDLWMLYLLGFMWGFTFGGVDISLVALISDVFGLRGIGMIIGVLNIAWGVGAAVGSTVGGFIYDLSHSYFIAFLTGAATMLTLALLAALFGQKEIRSP